MQRTPACTRCGHTLKQHYGSFGGPHQGCRAKVALEGLAQGRCACPGFVLHETDEGVAVVDVREPRLNGPGGASDAVDIEAARDLFDLPVRDDTPPMPWRPY